MTEPREAPVEAHADQPTETRTEPPVGPPFERRPWLERIGLAAIATVMGSLFTLVAIAAGAGGEWILAAMSAIGAFMTVAVGLSTLIRG